MTQPIELRNGRVVTPTGLVENGRVVLTGDRISHVDDADARPIRRARTIDVDGQLILPGLVDLHGDDIEHQLHPRAGASVDVGMALAAADRANVCCGVTTKFHAISFEDAPDEDRTITEATAIAREIESATYTVGDNRMHARCELAPHSVDAVERLGSEGLLDLVSVMHHAPDDGQFDRDQFERHYHENRQLSRDAVDRIAAERQRLSLARRTELVDRVATLASTIDVPLASHDDDSPATVDRMADHGVSISEYPLTIEAARRAKERGSVTAMGAPNLVRGGSLWDNLSAEHAIAEGLLDVLCSDYHPQSLLVAGLIGTGEPLHVRVNRVSKNPADAVGLTDRGRLEPGARADVIVVDPSSPATVSRTFVAGVEAFSGGQQPAIESISELRRPHGPGS